MTIRDVNGEQALLRQQFVVGDVTGCLLSLGQLYKSGWKVHQADYEGLSLAIHGSVRCIVNENLPEFRLDLEDGGVEYMWTVRMLVDSKGEMDEPTLSHWRFTADGVLYFKCVGHEFVDPRPAFGETYPRPQLQGQGIVDGGMV